MRDNFKQTIIERLRARVNNRCSNPDCRVPTTGPTTDPEKVTSIGIAAHITAASPGGPRYDASLSPEKRKSISNAIWLCSNCSIKIDRNPDAFSLEKLQNWKRIAENKATEEIGKKLPDDNYVIQSLTAAMSGQSSDYLSSIIANSCKATSKALEKLDQRFIVKASHKNNLTSYELWAKENIPAKMTINSKFSKEFLEKYKQLEEHGETLIIDSDAIEIEGSPLLESIFNNEHGRFEFSSQFVKNCIQKIWLQNNDPSNFSMFYDVHGKAVLGKSSMTFSGESLEGLIATTFRFSHQILLQEYLDLFFKINFAKWDKKDIINLPYFDQLYDFFCKIKEGFTFYSSLELEGKRLLSGHSSTFYESEYFKYTYSHLHYIYMVKQICIILGTSIHYDYSYEYDVDEYIHIDEMYRTLSGEMHITKNSIKGNPKCTLEVSDDLSNIHSIHEAKGSCTSIRIEEYDPGRINPFFQTLILPKLTYTFSGVTPVIKGDISTLNPRDLVEIEWEPTEEFQYKIERA